MTPKICVVCGSSYTPRSWTTNSVPQCSPECKQVLRDKRAKVVVVPCLMCPKLVTVRGRKPLHRLWKGFVYCSLECQNARKSQSSRAAMTPAKRLACSQRMRANNPMRLASTRNRVSVSLKARGHKPPVRGGNGRGPTVPEKKLSRALRWPLNVIVPTGAPRGTGYPTCYKIDLGSKRWKLAIEVDGPSHNCPSRRAQDRKKERFLKSRGWTVLRFTNGAVRENLTACVQAVRATVEELKKGVASQ